MSWNPLDWLKPASALVGSIGKAIDDNITSDEERMTLKNALVGMQKDFQVRMEELRGKADEELTKRLESDNEGSTLSRNVRPLTLIYLLFVVTILAITDGNLGSFVVKGAYVSLFELLLMTAFGFYFGSRGLEKIARIWKSK